ncbi:MAG: NAD(P)H-hydrate dehydratase [Acidobacteriota bacterium]
MIPVLDNAAMREADRITIRELGMPSMVLMERAAEAVSETVVDRFPEVGAVLIACGPGNNGGDGLAAARQLRCRGVAVEVALLVEPGTLKGDAARQLALARAYGVPVSECAGIGLETFSAMVTSCDVVVDALFGTGLDRPLDGRWQTIVEVINAAGRPVVAVDVPSGLSGSSAAIPGPAIEASVTVTFAAAKLAHALPPACWSCGEVAVGEIGIPPWVIEDQATLGMIEAADVAGWLPRRAPDAHKGDFGHLLLVAGRLGRAGAAALGAKAAVRSGAGLVTVATAAGAVAPIQSQVPEAMVDPLPADAGGMVGGEGIEALLDKATALAVGPGLGVGDGPRQLLDRILASWHGPLLLDADALTLMSGQLERLRGRGAPTVLTPHPGELARLLGTTTPEVVANRLAAAREAASRSGATVLAKGARTVIVEAEGRVFVNPTGGPGLAVGGSGDVLTGLVGGLLAQGLAGRAAAGAGSWLHGRAGELAAERFPGAIPASVVVDHLAAAEAEAREAL